MSTLSIYAADRLQGIHAISTLREGVRLQKNVPSLKSQVIKLLILNLIIFIFISLLLNGIFYYYLIDPAINWFFGVDGGFFTTMGRWFLGFVQLSVAAVFAFVSLRLSVALMSIWHQQLVLKVISYYRPITEVSVSYGEWLKNIIGTFKETLKLCLIPLIILLVGVIPGFGLLIIFFLESYLLGRDTLMVCLDEIQTSGEREELKSSLRWLPFKLGWLPMLFAFVPVVGWLMMPLVIILMVVGLTSYLERART